MLRLYGGSPSVARMDPIDQSGKSAESESSRRRTTNISYGIIAGLLLGVVMGSLFGGLALWIAIGVAIGIASGAVIDFESLLGRRRQN